MKAEQIILAVEVLNEMGLYTNLRNVANYMEVHVSKIKRPIKKCCDNGYLYSHRGRYFVTEDGEELLQQAREHPYDDDWFGFSYEVLTGITDRGKETDIVNPALPKPPGPPRGKNYIEDRTIHSATSQAYAREVLSNHPDMSIERLAEYWENEQIKQCSKCGRLAVHAQYKNGMARYCLLCQREQRDG